jgi:hypothetical protein
MIGARFEITVDGQPRTNRDLKAIALAAGELLARRDPNAKVTVRDRVSGEVIVIKGMPSLK